MNLPTYVKHIDQENYNQELNQTLLEGVSNNGYVIPTVTNAQLTVNAWIAPDGTVTTLALGMPDGTTWYVSDAVPPGPVMKIAGVLRRLVDAVYP